MMNARTLLFRQLQHFFEAYLPSKHISGMRFDQPELAPKEKGLRQRPHEVVAGSFDGFRLSITSTAEAPPLGRIICTSPNNDTVEGVIDHQTWCAIAAMINRTEGTSHVDH
ncbi:MAG TPA: hypothetical protein VK577_03140 [Bradyrhizobium sp.]|nr:hypothetical protein [Bradyrhizobium sp.]